MVDGPTLTVNSVEVPTVKTSNTCLAAPLPAPNAGGKNAVETPPPESQLNTSCEKVTLAPT